MENFKQIFILIANNGIIHLNFDILETGLINILALLVIVVSFGNDFIFSYLTERRNVILLNMVIAEKNLNDAQLRFHEATQKLEQATITSHEIKINALKAQKVLLKTDASKMQKDLKFRFERAIKNIYLRERDIIKAIKIEITSTALDRIGLFVIKRVFDNQQYSSKFMDSMINLLELK